MVEISIQTILQESTSDIIIGYVSEKDISKFRKISTRISFVNLESDLKYLDIPKINNNYQQYTEDAFYSIVQLKWPLILKTLNEFPQNNVIYSDADVIWCTDASSEIEMGFQNQNEISIFVQNLSTSPAETSLCMGFVGFRNNEISKQIIGDAIEMHKANLIINPKSGDDAVITNIYRSNRYERNIGLLPQSTFPVGNLINNFTKRHLYPGLGFDQPIIFHANYVIGLHRKVLLMYLLLKNIGKHKKIFRKKNIIQFEIELKLRRIKSHLNF